MGVGRWEGAGWVGVGGWEGVGVVGGRRGAG